MKEKRKHSRKRVNCAFQVVDMNMDQAIGCLVDLSVDGFMLLSDAPIDVGSVFQLRIQLTEEMNGRRNIDVGAESLWCNPANRQDHFWTGFHVIDLSPESEAIIDQITRESPQYDSAQP